MLNDLPLAWDHLQRLGDGLAELAQTVAATAVTGGRAGDDPAFTWQMLGERLARGALARKRRDGRCLRGSEFRSDLGLGGRGFQVFEFQLHLVDQPRGAL